MKILFTFLTFGKDVFAGMENSLYSLCQGILKVGSTPLVYTTSHYVTSTSVDNIKVYRSKGLKLRHFGKDFSQEEEIRKKSCTIIKELEEIIKKENPDCIIAWDPLWGIITLLNHKFKKDCFLVHHVIQNKRIINAVNNFNFRGQFAVSKSLRTDLQNFGIKQKMEILSNCIDLDAYEPLKIKKWRGIRDVICNSRLSSEKGVEYCVEAFGEYIKSINPDARLFLFSGSFPFGNVNKEKEKILNLIDNLDIKSNVLFIPNMKWSAIPQFISKGDVSIVPSLRETFGISVLESMAARTPVICTNVGNLPDLTRGSAILVKPKDPQGIYSALIKLNSDRVLYEQFQEEGFRLSKVYDSTNIAKLLIKNIKK